MLKRSVLIALALACVLIVVFIMRSPEKAQFQSGSVVIRYTDLGMGTPVVFVHGLTGSGSMWRSFDAIEGFRLIKMDCRGHGDSDRPHDVDAYGLEMVEDVVRLLDHLEIEKAHLVGYSMGAEIVIKFGTLYPDRVRSLVAGGSGWSLESDANNYRLIAKSLKEGSGLGGVINSLGNGDQYEISSLEIAMYDAMLLLEDTDALAAVSAGMEQLINLSADALASLDFPVLGIAGEHDPERENIERMGSVVPDFTMHVISDADHETAVADPEFRDEIVEFLERG